MRTDLPRLALYALVAVVLLGVVIGASTSGAAYGAFNPSWDGGSSLRGLAESNGTDAVYLEETSEYNGLSNETVAFILAPDRQYDTNDSERVRTFLERGGTLVVADDTVDSNDLLEAIGASARVNGQAVRDERRHYRGPALPIATNVTSPAELANRTNTSANGTAANLTAGIDRLTLNYGSVLEPGSATVLVSTSEFAYLDTNGNEELDETETLASRPVVAIESVEEGTVVVMSDGSALINAMLDRSDNRQFANALINEGEQVALDNSHSATLPPLAALLVAFRSSALFQLWVGLVFCWAVGLFLAWPTVRERDVVKRLKTRFGVNEPEVNSEFTADAAAAALRQRRPDWDEARIERVARVLVGEGTRDPWRGDHRPDAPSDGED
jgi:hypothetical protein